MSIGKVLGGTIIVTPAVGVVGYVTYDQLYSSETVAGLKPTGAPFKLDRELNRRAAEAVGIDESGSVDVTLGAPARN